MSDKSTEAPLTLPLSCIALQQVNATMEQALVSKRRNQIRELIGDVEASREKALSDSIFIYSRQGADPAISQSYATACSEAMRLLSEAAAVTSDMIAR